MVSNRLTAVEGMRGEPTPGLPRRPSRRRSVAARWRGREPELGGGERFSGADRVRSQRRRGGKEAEGRTEGVAVNNGEWHERVAMIMLASVAQQSVAPERGPRRSHDSFNAVARAR